MARKTVVRARANIDDNGHTKSSDVTGAIDVKIRDSVSSETAWNIYKALLFELQCVTENEFIRGFEHE